MFAFYSIKPFYTSCKCLLFIVFGLFIPFILLYIGRAHIRIFLNNPVLKKNYANNWVLEKIT